MIINRTVEFVNYRSPSHTGTGRTPVFIRRTTGEHKSHDTVEISEQARQKLIETAVSSLEKAVLKALPGVEQVMEYLRETERDFNTRRRGHVDRLRSRILSGQYEIDDKKLAQASETVIRQLIGK